MKQIGYALALLLLRQPCLIAQFDSITYYNQYWKITEKDSAHFYRIVFLDAGIYHVTDYYTSGKIQMEGNYSSLEPEIQEGYFIWYFENGQKFVEGNFLHGQREGIWTFWYPDGLKKQEVKFQPGQNEFVVRWSSTREKNTGRLIEKASRQMQKGKLHAAESLLNAALMQNPYSADAFFKRGILRCAANQNNTGCEDLRKAKEYGFFDTDVINKTIEEHCLP